MVKTIIAQIIRGDLKKVNRWDYYVNRKAIMGELQRANLLSEEIKAHLFSLQDSVRETL